MSRILPLESLRGLAALSVVLYHFDINSALNTQFSSNAWLMVDFFFVLSGFVISLSSASKLDAGAGLVGFVKRRFLRLYPLHLLVLIGFVVFEIGQFAAVRLIGLDLHSAPFTGSKDVPSLVANVFLVHNLTLDRLTWNFPSWSISSEFFAYLIFAAVLFATRMRPHARVAAIGLIVLASLVIIEARGMTTTNLTGPARCLFSFFIGHVTCLVAQRSPDRPFTHAGVVALCAAVAAITLEDAAPRALVPLYPLLFAVAIYCVVKTGDESPLFALLSAKPLVFLGAISYGIYMWHALILNLVAATLRIVFDVPAHEDPDGGLILELSSAAFSNALMAGVLALTVLTAWLSHRVFERRFYQ